MFELFDQTIDPHQLQTELDNPKAGAFVCFEGRVRNHNDGQQVQRLEYEAYDELAVKEGNKVIEEARSRFAILECRAVHRTGCLEVGEIAVWVGVLSAHRAQAFDACRYIIDELKCRVPVWKKEHYVNGATEWINCANCAPTHSHSKTDSHKHEKESCVATGTMP
jgi:molybdopterin synthase catalytic subunit